MTIRDARGILADAEKALRDLMQREIREQRYRDIPEVARLTDGVARLLREEPPPAPREVKATSESAPARSTPRKKKPRKRSASSKSKYPKFVRDGDKLVKIGWSKKAREEYQHRAPWEAVAAFASHLNAEGHTGETFAVEDLLPVPDSAGGEVPNYQVYLTLAWLRQAGVVSKKGRNGYLLEHEIDIHELWDVLTVRTV